MKFNILLGCFRASAVMALIIMPLRNDWWFAILMVAIILLSFDATYRLTAVSRDEKQEEEN